MGLSLLSPLELGPAFKNQTGENGSWLHYKVGLRDPETGKFIWVTTKYWMNGGCTISASDGQLFLGGYNPLGSGDHDWNTGAVIVHTYEELAQHHGQMELTRDVLLHR